MSQRSLKKQIGVLLAMRDDAYKTYRRYAFVLGDLALHTTDTAAVKARMVQINMDVQRFQQQAHELAGQLKTAKQTFAGRWLDIIGAER